MLGTSSLQRRAQRRSKRGSLQVVQAALESRAKPDRINALPREMVLAIFEFFDVHTLLTCTGVCKTWFELGTEPYFSDRLRVQRISSRQFPPLISWNPLEYYNLFSLAAQSRKKELANYEFFNCSRYCEMWQHTELGSKVTKLSSDARRSLNKATKQIEDKVEDRVRKLAMNPKVSKVSDGVKKVKDKFKAIYKEKANKVKAKLGGFVEDAQRSSRSISGRFQMKISRIKQRFKEFYQERFVGPTTSYSCIGHQMRNFVLSSVLLQHVAFTVLLWRHWDKTEAAAMDFTSKAALLGLVALYWIFALVSMFKRNAPQWLLYVCMSLVLVHVAPFQIVAFDFLLLLLTIALATVSVFDIYHRLYKNCLIVERSVLQDHLFMALQVTLLFLHLSSAPLVTLLMTLVAVFTWRDFVSFFQLQRGQHFLSQARQLVQTQAHKWVAISIANLAWIFFSVKFLGSLMPFSLLHPHTFSASTPSLLFLAAELTVFHCCILIKYEIRYPDSAEEEEEQAEQEVQQVQHHHHHHHHHQHHQHHHHHQIQPLLPPAPQQQNQQNIPLPPPLPPHWRQRLQPLHALQQQQAQASADESARPSMTLLHPTVYWHYVWILGVFCDFLMGLLDRLGYDGLSQTLSLVLPVVVLVAVLPIQIHYWNHKWNYDLEPCNTAAHHLN